MHRQGFSRAPLMVVCGVFAILLAIPSAALANHISAAASSASCVLVDDVPTVTFNIEFQAFSDINKPVSGTIELDGTVVKTYSDVTWTGSDFTLVYTQATSAGAHVLRGDFTWPGKTAGDNGSVEKSVDCPAAPTIGITVDKAAVETTAVAGTTVHFTIAVTNTGDTPFVQYTFSDPSCTTLSRTGANAGDAAFDPGDVWTYACSMATQAGQTSADNTATATGTNAEGKSATATDSASIPLTQPSIPPTQPPGGGVLPETVLSGLARLRGPSGCVHGAFTARVKGRSIASVSFFVDGKRVKRFTTARSRYTVKVRAGTYGLGRHRVVVRVRFAAASQTKPRTLRLTFRRCGRGTVAPRFTG